jgi:hypothetical protein
MAFKEAQRMIKGRLCQEEKNRDDAVAKMQDVFAEAERKEEAFPFMSAKKRSEKMLKEKEGGDFSKLFFGTEPSELQECGRHPCNDGSTQHKSQSYKDLHKPVLAYEVIAKLHLGPNSRFLSMIQILRKSPTLQRVCQFAQNSSLLKNHRI